ncbi:MAG: hypothetical protein Q7W51_00205 [Coriobacteriia bacterium]|nr:hypothetical protein [Coriobacteriia bacterium]
MSDEMNETTQPVADDTGANPEAADAWREVVAGLDAFGEALGRWVNAAANDPENKRRLDELSTRLDGIVDSVGATVKGAAEGDVGQSFKEAADKTGEAFKAAGEKVSAEVGPKLAGAFKSLSEKLRGAAEKMEDRAAAADAPADGNAPPAAPADPAEPSA